MLDVGNVRAVANAAIADAVANARAQQPFSGFIHRNSAQLFDYATGDDKRHFKKELQRLLQTEVPDPTMVLRGLIIQLNGVFEGFIKSLVSAQVEYFAKDVERFSELEEKLRAGFVTHASRVLTKLHDGTINGITYDFCSLQASVGSCLSDASPFQIQGDVFTILMGNCTPERLKIIFGQVGLFEPFGDQVGRHKAVQTLYQDSKARRNANRLEDDLSRHIEGRNDLVHGLATKAIVVSDVEDCANFFSAVVSAYCDTAVIT